MLHIDITDIKKLPAAASTIIELTSRSKKNVVALYGQMGAGKTTIIKEICKQMGVTSATSSPTFSIVNEYVTDKKSLIYHIDCYRLNKLSEFYDLGYEEYLYDENALCFIEWPEKIEPLLPDERINIRFALDGDLRTITLSE